MFTVSRQFSIRDEKHSSPSANYTPTPSHPYSTHSNPAIQPILQSHDEDTPSPKPAHNLFCAPHHSLSSNNTDDMDSSYPYTIFGCHLNTCHSYVYGILVHGSINGIAKRTGRLSHSATTSNYNALGKLGAQSDSSTTNIGAITRCMLGNALYREGVSINGVAAHGQLVDLKNLLSSGTAERNHGECMTVDKLPTAGVAEYTENESVKAKE